MRLQYAQPRLFSVKAYFVEYEFNSWFKNQLMKHCMYEKVYQRFAMCDTTK